MASDVTTYDYDEIDAVVGRLKAAASEIETTATELHTSVKAAMSDWTGATADAYESRSTDLKSDLDASRAWLDQVATTMKNGADSMSAQDSMSAKGLLQH